MEKKTFVTKEQLDMIIKEYPTPFHLYDEKGLRENVKSLQEAFEIGRASCRERVCLYV